MAKYRERCTDCGARKYKQIDENTYECTYCGNIHHVEVKQEKYEEVPKSDEAIEELVKEIDERLEKLEELEEYEELKNEEKEHKLTYFFLTLFLGSFGVHKFYKGKILMGLIYLFTHGLFGVGYIIDIINAVINLAKNNGRN